MNKNHWTYEEIKYLKENWGQVSISGIAKKLNRSVLAIKNKSYKIGLRNMLQHGEYISLNEFWKTLNVQYKTKDIKKLKAAKFPISYQKIITKKVKVIDMNHFWNWFKKNIHLIDLSKTEKGCFGYEPEWVELKRQADKRAAEYKKTAWTASEEDYLIRLLKTYKYSYRELSIMLKRTEGAIKRKMIDLKLKMRPLKADNTILWTQEEIRTVKDLYKKGFKSCIIAEYVNRSALAINGLLERHCYFNDNNAIRK
jgi:hypothetical protein